MSNQDNSTVPNSSSEQASRGGYDLIVIGAGVAGMASANKASAHGWRVAIVDSLPYGGTCALRGCDPKKSFDAEPKLSIALGS